jgi:hypothetical protein
VVKLLVLRDSKLESPPSSSLSHVEDLVVAESMRGFLRLKINAKFPPFPTTEFAPDVRCRFRRRLVSRKSEVRFVLELVFGSDPDLVERLIDSEEA